MHDTHRTHGARLWTRLCFVALTVVFLGSLGTAIVAAQAKPSGKTVWDGVYTDAQAERATDVQLDLLPMSHAGRRRQSPAQR